MASAKALERARRARTEFTWGRDVKEELIFRAHDPPPLVQPLFVLEQTEYVTIKGVPGSLTLWFHRHTAPLPMVMGEPETGEFVSSRTCPHYQRPLFVLGELARLAGQAKNGPRELVFDRGTYFLCGDPITKQMFVLPRKPEARPFWIARRRSNYTITARGIEG